MEKVPCECINWMRSSSVRASLSSRTLKGSVDTQTPAQVLKADGIPQRGAAYNCLEHSLDAPT